jgi:hypothetical protein
MQGPECNEFHLPSGDDWKSGVKQFMLGFNFQGKKRDS